MTPYDNLEISTDHHEANSSTHTASSSQPWYCRPFTPIGNYFANLRTDRHTRAVTWGIFVASISQWLDGWITWEGTAKLKKLGWPHPPSEARFTITGVSGIINFTLAWKLNYEFYMEAEEKIANWCSKRYGTNTEQQDTTSNNENYNENSYLDTPRPLAWLHRSLQAIATLASTGQLVVLSFLVDQLLTDYHKPYWDFLAIPFYLISGFAGYGYPLFITADRLQQFISYCYHHNPCLSAGRRDWSLFQLIYQQCQQLDDHEKSYLAQHLPGTPLDEYTREDYKQFWSLIKSTFQQDEINTPQRINKAFCKQITKHTSRQLINVILSGFFAFSWYRVGFNCGNWLNQDGPPPFSLIPPQAYGASAAMTTFSLANLGNSDTFLSLSDQYYRNWPNWIIFLAATIISLVSAIFQFDVTANNPTFDGFMGNQIQPVFAATVFAILGIYSLVEPAISAKQNFFTWWEGDKQQQDEAEDEAELETPTDEQASNNRRWYHRLVDCPCTYFSRRQESKDEKGQSLLSDNEKTREAYDVTEIEMSNVSNHKGETTPTTTQQDEFTEQKQITTPRPTDNDTAETEPDTFHEREATPIATQRSSRIGKEALSKIYTVLAQAHEESFQNSQAYDDMQQELFPSY